MSKKWKRVIAYLIDIFIITLLVQNLSSLNILNPQIKNYQKYMKSYQEKSMNYTRFIMQLHNDYEDKELTEKEYHNLIEKYPSYELILTKYYKDNKLEEKNYEKLTKEVTNEYKNESSELYYKIEKNSLAEMILYLVLTLFYFIGFNIITNGQTLGKKLMRLQIVNTNDGENVSWQNYLIRYLLMYEVLFYLTRLICIITLKKSQYIPITNTANYIQSILDFAIFTMILMRKDGRGLHEILSKTKVKMYNKNNIEIE